MTTESCATCGQIERFHPIIDWSKPSKSCEQFIPLEQHKKKDCIPKSKYTPQKKEVFYSITPAGIKYVEEELLKLKKKKK